VRSVSFGPDLERSFERIALYVVRLFAAAKSDSSPIAKVNDGTQERGGSRRLLIVLLTVLLAALTAAKASAQQTVDSAPPEIKSWLIATDRQQGTITPGTRITTGNWRRYQQFMPMGMQELFGGRLFWKMPKEAQMEVGPTVINPLPPSYTEAQSKAVRVVHLSDGHNDIVNYVAGEPFPDPQEPDKGYKLLVDLWLAYAPHLIVGTPANPFRTCVEDEFNSISCTLLSYVYRQTAYNTDPGVARQESGDTWFTEWTAVEAPEQSKYTAQLTEFFKNNQRPEELYVYIPSFRRSLRLGIPARCTQVVGTDYLQDDARNIGFNGGIALFDAHFLGHRKILAMTGTYAAAAGDFPGHYYMPIGWPTPSWGPWQVRDVDVIDVRRVRSERAGYCYGSRIIYEDAYTHYALWEDVYDAHLRLWKIALVAPRDTPAPMLGLVPASVTSCIWDVQNNHMTTGTTQDAYGHDVFIDSAVPAQYRDLARYSTPGGLIEIMK
jgi:hypothetical protein